MKKITEVNNVKPSSNLKIDKKAHHSQKFMKKFLEINKKHNVDKKYKNLAEYIFHLLAIMEDMDTNLDQLRCANLEEDESKKLKEKLQLVKQNCIATAKEQSKSLSESLSQTLKRYLTSLEQTDSKEAEETSSTNRVLQTEEVDKIKKAVKEAVYKAVTMKRLIDNFITDGTPLPVVKDKDNKGKEGIYIAPIKMVMKDHCSLDNLPVVHTKVLPTGKSEQESELPVIRHNISDESTFRCYPDLKNKIPHSSYTLFSSNFDRVMDRSGSIVELSGMKKIEGLHLSDEDLSEEDQKEMAALLQNGEQTSLAEVIKAHTKAKKVVTDIHVTEKANGAYASCQVLKSPDGNGKSLLFVSSKTSPLFLKIPKDGSVEEKTKKLIEELQELKQSKELSPLLVFIATKIIDQLSQCTLEDRDLFNPDHPFWKGGMCVGEAEQGNHIIPLTDDPKIRWFKQTGLDASVSIEQELNGLKAVGLCTVDHYSIGIEKLAAKEKEWRDSKDKEGFVVYYKVDGKVNQIKYKAIPYIILRALREFLGSKRGKECFGVPFKEKSASAVLSSANRPKHVAQVIEHFLETHPHLQALCKNEEFSPIIKKNIKEYKSDFPRFIQYLLGSGYCERDLGFEGDFGIGQLYKKFKEGGIQAEEKFLSFSGNFQGLIIAISGPPGIGKDTVAEKLAQHAVWERKPVILSKDRAAEALQSSSDYNSLSDEGKKTQRRYAWLNKEIQKAVMENLIIITTTCNSSSKELAWITDAAKQYNLAVIPVYPEVSCKKDRTAFLAALIVSVLRRQDHPTLSASEGESLNGKFAKVIKDRVIEAFYTYASADADGSQKIPTHDFNDKYSPTQLLNYFDLSKFDAFIKKIGLSEEQTKIQNALLDVVKFIKNEEKEISNESLVVLRKAKESEINKIFQRVEADKLSNALMEKINKLEKKGLHYQGEKQKSSIAFNYYGAFLNPKAREMLKEKLRETLKNVKELPEWIKTYLTDETMEPNSSELKNDKKQVRVADRSSMHLTLAHANSLHKLSVEASAMLEKMVAENEDNGAEVELKVEGICYNEGVLYASGVRVMCQKEGVFSNEDKTNSLVASKMAHITLAKREGIAPIYALFSEKEKTRIIDSDLLTKEKKAEIRCTLGIKTIIFEQPLSLAANVRTDCQDTRICKEKIARTTFFQATRSPTADETRRERSAESMSPAIGGR